MCFGGGKSAPTTPTVDPEAERRKAEADAAAKANEQILADSRRKRQQKGLLSTEDGSGSVLASGGSTSTSAPASTVLGSGGA